MMSNTEAYTLSKLAEILGAPTELQAKANEPRESDAELIKRGAQIASTRILSDVESLYGLAYAFWIKATDEQKDLLIGFSDDVLRYAVDRAIALQSLNEDINDSGFLDQNEINRRKKEAANAFSAGVLLRDRARNVLKKAAPDAATIQQIGDSAGTAETDESLAKGIERLAAISLELLKTQDPVAQERLKSVRLTKSFAEQLSNAAQKIRATAKDAAARTTSKKTSQGDIDRLDGVNLSVLQGIVNTFEDAHDADPSIPRLVPSATRRLLGRRASK